MSSPARGLVGHPGSNHLAYQLVAALQRHGFDVGFETGVFWTGKGLVPKFTALLPEASRAKLERELKRRSHAGVAAASVAQRPLAELLYIATTRLKLAPETQLAAIAWRNDLFDAQFAARVSDERPDFVVGHDSSALAAQRAAQRYGGLAILNQVIGHIATGLELFAQEAALAPEFAETLPLPPKRVIAQCTTEAIEADRVIVPSTYVADTMVANGTDPTRIFVLPYGVDTTRFCPAASPRADDGKFRVLFVGGLTQRKGIKYLLEAAKRAWARSSAATRPLRPMPISSATYRTCRSTRCTASTRQPMRLRTRRCTKVRPLRATKRWPRACRSCARPTPAAWCRTAWKGSWSRSATWTRSSNVCASLRAIPICAPAWVRPRASAPKNLPGRITATVFRPGSTPS